MSLLWQIGRACAYTPTALKIALRMEKGWGEVHSPYTRLKNTLPTSGLLIIGGRGVGFAFLFAKVIVKVFKRSIVCVGRYLCLVVALLVCVRFR